jgi:hypothetical protein
VPEIYLNAAIVSMNPIKFVVRSPIPEASLVPSVRRAIQSVNPQQPIHEVKMMSAIVAESMALKTVAASVMSFSRSPRC